MNANETAKQALDRNTKLVEKHLKAIQARLADLKRLPNPHWANVGDAAHLEDMLKDLASVD